MKTPVYLDHHASTPLDPRVREVWERAVRDHFGNPASAGHAYGWAAAKLVETAREHVAALLGATVREIVFTGGATEADNLALLGLARAHVAGPRRTLVTTNLEHPAVRAPLDHLAAHEGWSLRVVPSGSDGLVEPAALVASLDEGVLAVSVIAAQNEIGTVQPLAALAQECRSRGIIFHTDAAQAAGRVAIDVVRDGLDLVSLSGHKMYGPKGVGALYVRRRDPRVELAPLVFGGGQERGLRPGTPAVPAIAAFGEACRLALAERASESARVAALRDLLWDRLQAGLDDIHLNGHPTQRLPGNLNVSFGGLPPGRLVGALTVLAVSTGSACSSGDGKPSGILAALGVPAARAAASLRLGLGRFTTAEEIEFAADTIIAAVKRLRGE